MLAVFKKENETLTFINFWQEQQNEASWKERTARALGLRPDKLVIFQCPSLRNDEAYKFEYSNDIMNLLKFGTEKAETLITNENGEEVLTEIEIIKVVSKEELQLI